MTLWGKFTRFGGDFRPYLAPGIYQSEIITPMSYLFATSDLTEVKLLRHDGSLHMSYPGKDVILEGYDETELSMYPSGLGALRLRLGSFKLTFNYIRRDHDMIGRVRLRGVAGDILDIYHDEDAARLKELGKEVGTLKTKVAAAEKEIAALKTKKGMAK